MTNYENDIQVITKNGAEGELTQVSINNGEIENVNTTTLSSEANELNPLAEPVATGQKNIISVDEASSVSSGNNIYINQDNKLMQIDYDTLATAILNKLSTQSFNSLNTSSKLVLDAINELNGKTSIFNESSPTDIDLNDLISPATYSTSGSAPSTKGWKNYPTNSTGYVQIEKFGGIVKQTYTTHDGEMFVRCKLTEWSSWKYIQLNALS